MNYFLIICALLPNFLKLLIYRNVFGWKIGRDVKIGFSYIESRDVCLGDRVKIGHFNIIRNLKSLQIGRNTCISNFNSIFGVSFEDCQSALEIGQSVNFMSHHFLDVGGKITIGDYVVFGGRNTQVWGHSLRYTNGQLAFKPIDVTVGKNAYIGARATLVGCTIPDRTVVGAGSVVTKQFAPEPCPYLIAGNPATIKKRYLVAPPEPSALTADND
jgi:acetyltransferase-like isoleucine patch superfamily enzyme